MSSNDKLTNETRYHVIVDPSSLVFGGITRLKKWQTEYRLTVFVPNYTLRELDFLKRSINPVVARNARESIRVIDAAISEDPADTHNPRNVQFLLESPEEAGPDWKKASSYRQRTPLLGEIPTMAGGYGLYQEPRNKTTRTVNTGFEKQQELAKDTDQHEKAKVPPRLRYLIRSCIQKQYVENKKRKPRSRIDWVVVCEDPVTSTWLRCFGFKVLSMNQMEAFLEQRDSSDPPKVANEAPGMVKTQDYRKITFAPRGSGKLWTP
ncbi:hypothetical protein KL929_001741 [Ogataea haglerorum]|nr:hypothetical protein KL915_001278 [Ogataea haglerorum]KAG7700589.1 hypothetical protein KL951_000704 [Ogataea haglerorum]KAG7720489.1 hypothetical protein KL913_001389 [Ogataea haglerorum]KAG7720875.1 hypothetical protein KL949_001747 [Ogataea haglerorum]KAG7748487.1 hypothetical protein KL912_002392 [Ogataea haglerorum]